MRTLEGSNRVRNGLMAIIILLLVIGVGQSFTSVPMLFATPTYYAQFKDAGGINAGDKISIAGVDVGRVRSLDIDGDKILVEFSLGGNQIGKNSRAAIRTDTILGRRNIEIENRGSADPCAPAGCCRWVRPARRIRSTTRSSTSPKRRRAGTSTPSSSR